MPIFRRFLLLAAFVLPLSACSSDKEAAAVEQKAVVSAPEQATSTVKLTTNMGVIVLEVDHINAPISADNFVQYVKDGHYDGIIFHRVIKDFMVQGGGFDKDYKERASRDEIANEADNGLKNDRGTVAMARTSAPHSASSQFFINLKDNAFLNHTKKSSRGWGYAVFAKVVEGMDVVDKIANTPTGRGGPFGTDAPLAQVIIESAELIK